MPPNSNTNNNIPNTTPPKIGLNPIFKGMPSQPTNTAGPKPVLGAFNVLNNQQYKPSQPIVPTPKPVIPTNTGPKSIIRTYKGDLETAIQAGHLTSINIAVAENEKMRKQIRQEEPASAPAQEATGEYSKSKILLFVSIIIVIIGIAGILFTLVLNNPNINPIANVPTLPSLITTEFKDELNINSVAAGQFANALASKLNDSQITVNSLYNTYITTGTSTARKLATASEFISLLGLRMPDMVKRTILPDFMVGTYATNRNLPFVIFKTSSFDNSYAGMLAWENNLEKDMRILFRLPGYEQGNAILNDLTPTNTKKFIDSVIVNKDVRVLKDDSGEIMLLYGIIDKETIVITVSDAAFKEIVDRLNKEKTLKR